MFRLSRQNEIFIDTTSRTLFLKQNDELLHQFPIAIGKSSTPTPIGKWEIINKKILTDSSIFGSRWLGLSAHSYGIHGTNNPSSIGSAVSLGCIRMHNHDVETLFPLVSIGTPVTISAGSQLKQPPKLNHQYLVQKGDTLWHIAKRENLSLETLLALNPHLTASQLFAGQIIQLP